MNTSPYLKLTLVTINGQPKLCHVEADKGIANPRNQGQVKMSFDTILQEWCLPQDACVRIG